MMIDDTEVVPDEVPEVEDTAAFDAGVAKLGDKPEPATETVVEAKETPEPAAEVVEPTAEEKAAADQKAADDAEIKKLGIKNETAAERFRVLNAEARKVPELTKQIEQYKPLAEEAERFNAIIADTKARPEQIGAMLKYLKSINGGDPAEMNAAADTILNEAKALFKFLGRELPAFDPVAEHKDLTEAMEGGGMTPEGAKELVRLRAKEKADAARLQAENEQKQAAQENDRVITDAVKGLNDMGGKLKASDAHYSAKLAAMQASGTIELIKETVHPSQWVNAFQKAYAKIADPKPKPPIGNMPLRPTGSDPNAQQRVPKDEYEAFEIGAASVR